MVAGAERHVARVLVVDDGSGDGTGALARRAGAEVAVNGANLGKGAALAIGLNRLFSQGFDAAVCLDADGQHDPGEIPLFAAAAATADLVVGNRMADVERMPFSRRWTNRVTSRVVSSLAGVAVPDAQCGYRLITAGAWRGIAVESRNYDFESEMIVKAGRAGFRIASVPVTTIYRGDETSNIRPGRDAIRFFRLAWRLWRERK